MKKFKNVLILSILLLLILGNCSFAATSSTINYTKYIAIGIAALIVILLLFLGYKMDSKDTEDEIYIRRKPKDIKAEKEAEMLKEDTEYEADSSSYENDIINTNDLVETKEYDEDEEDLFSYQNNNNINDDLDEEILDDNESENNLSSSDSNIETEEEYGEEFDTSVLDSIDDEDDFNAKINNEINSGNDDLVNPPIEDDSSIDLLNTETDFSIDDIKKEETSFEGFSVNESNDEVKEQPKAKKKYTKVKSTKKSKQTNEEEFLNQIEENLKEEKTKRKRKK